MPVKNSRGKSDAVIKTIKAALARYQGDHAGASVELYRRSPASVRVRVIDPSFHRVSRGTRHRRVWKYLQDLDVEVLNDIGWLLLLSPQEAESSMSNAEFEDPAPVG